MEVNTAESLVPVPGGQLWTVAEGIGPPVAFISGGPGCCDYLGPITRRLTDGVRTIRFDARGCGRSTESSEYTVEQSIADLEAIRRHHSLDRWAIAGHSWGADLALAYALCHPDRVLGLEVSRQLNLEWKRYIKRPGLLREIAAFDRPALFLYGDADIRPAWPAQQIASLLPDAEFHLFPGANHHVWLTHAADLCGLLPASFAVWPALDAPPRSPRGPASGSRADPLFRRRDRLPRDAVAGRLEPAHVVVAEAQRGRPGVRLQVAHRVQAFQVDGKSLEEALQIGKQAGPSMPKVEKMIVDEMAGRKRSSTRTAVGSVGD